MSEKLAALRAEMKKRNIDAFIVPRADEFQGEYVPPSNDRLAWITEFTGSAGASVIATDKAGFFTDGRYTLQAAAQVDAKDFGIFNTSLEDKPQTPEWWIENNLPRGATLGIDPWMHTPDGVKHIENAVKKAGGKLVMLEDNPLDAAWEASGTRPAAPLEPAVPHPLQFAGKSSEEKRAELSDALNDKGANALAITLPEEICWLLNVRGNDVPCTPFPLSYAIAHDDGKVDWFIDSRKVPQETKDWVGPDVTIRDLSEFAPALGQLAAEGKKIWVDPARAPAKVENAVLSNGGHIHSERSPLQLMKAKKNAVEMQGMIDAHIRDGVAETRFLSAISQPGAAAKLDEISASDMLEKFRSEGQYFKGLSFDTISGAGGNGAIVHYRSSPETNKPLLAGPVYLVDSGAQYLDGTTDITRTVAIDPPKVTAEMKDRFTRVLVGHIRVAMSEFPEGTVGCDLDVKAREKLKEEGLDYAHGTGHGVGSYLSVHEGPAGIHKRATSVPLEAGMIISNEPGFYKENEYGIRIESLVAVVETGKTAPDGKKMLGFRTITQAPIDRNLVEPTLLSDAELKWLNDYHEGVRKTLTPLLDKADPQASRFLQEATAPIQKPGAPAMKKNMTGLCL